MTRKKRKARPGVFGTPSELLAANACPCNLDADCYGAMCPLFYRVLPTKGYDMGESKDGGQVILNVPIHCGHEHHAEPDGYMGTLSISSAHDVAEIRVTPMDNPLTTQYHDPDTVTEAVDIFGSLAKPGVALDFSELRGMGTGQRADPQGGDH